MALSSYLFSLGTPLSYNQTHLTLYHQHPLHHHKKPSKVAQFSTAHLSNQLRNSRLRCVCQSQSKSTQKQEEEIKTQMGEVEQFEFERLFSNLNQANFKHEPGSLSSSIFLVAGTTIGAGILAIPAVTQESGFLASAVVCIGCWVFMVVTGLLIAEVNVNTMCELGSGGVSLVSMAKRTLGSVGVQISCWSYLFIHYALLVAYIARSSEILTNYLGIPLLESATLFSLVFGALCYFGSQRFIGAVNGLLVFGIVISFTALVVVASGNLHWDCLLKANWEAVPSSIPVIALAFVYQNVVPVLCTNLEGDLSKVRTAVVLGTAIPLLLFLVWNGVILGTITNLDLGVENIVDPLQQLRLSNGVVGPIVDAFSLLAIGTSYIGFVLGLADFLADYRVSTICNQTWTAVVLGTAIPLLLFLVWNGVILGTITNLDLGVENIVDPLQQLRLSNGVVGPIVDAFSLLAIGTSYIGFVLGLADFLADLLELRTGENKPLPYLITLFPPLVLSLLDPEIFFKALDFAGTYGVLVLFGVVPAAMSWSDRYSTSQELPKVAPLVPGGKLTLSLVIGGAGWVIISEILNNFSHAHA